jgi:hypothetical protein
VPARSKFTAPVKAKILELLAAGASRRAASAFAGVDHATLLRWLRRGENASEGSRFREFYEQVAEAEAHPKLRALQIVYNAIPDDPGLAWKFIERREPGYGSAPIDPPRKVSDHKTAENGPTVITLTPPGKEK